METEPIEYRQVKKIGGGSSNSWASVALLGVLGILLSLVSLVIAFALSPQRMSALMISALFTGLGFIIAGLAAGGIGQFQSRRELARGYTSLPSGNANAAQIDPRTGMVIREPGEASLPKQERLRRTALARAQARQSA